MSAVNNQFRLAVRLAETLESASRILFWMGPGKLAKSNAEQVVRERGRSSGKKPCHCLTMINGRCARLAVIPAYLEPAQHR